MSRSATARSRDSEGDAMQDRLLPLGDGSEVRCARCGMSPLSTLHLGAPGHDFAERDAEGCPECDLGIVIPDGPMESDTGHYPFRCSERCGWTS